jgi:RNA polymerase sigma factor (sigma-70 family)
MRNEDSSSRRPDGEEAGGRLAAQAKVQGKDQRAFDEVFSLVYEELRRLASFVRRNDAAATINSTALVHEAWVKLKDSPHLAETEVAHFKAIAAKAMRQVLVDEARRRGARKRGGSGEAVVVALGDSAEEPSNSRGISAEPVGYGASSLGTVPCGAELLELDATLEELSRLNPRQAQIVENRFFGGLNVAETAAALGVSESSVERDWRAAKAWLASKIHPARELGQQR